MADEIGNKMTDDKVDIMAVPVAEKSVDALEIPEISELQVGNKMTDDKIDIVELPVALKLQDVDIMANKSVDVPEILETSEFQVGDIMVVPDISENSEFEAMAEKKIDVSEIPENSEFEILGDIMADEKIDVLEVPENSELEVSGDIKRLSTGYAVVTNRAMTIRSRYLKASMGSCHDLCKYGIRNAAEEDGKNPKIKISISLKSVILAGRNKQLGLDRKPDSQGLGNATSQQLKRSITFQGLETVQEKNVSATLDRKSSLDSQSVGISDAIPRISEGNEGLGLETIQEIVTSEELALDNNDSETRELDSNPSVITSVVTSLSDKLTPPSKNGLLPPKDMDVIPSKHATSPKLKTKLSKPTPGSLKSIRVGESRKTKENGDSSMNSAGKGKIVTTSERGEKKVLVSSPVASSPKRSVKKLASVTNVKSPKNLVGRSNKTNATKLKSVQKKRKDIPEKTLFIIESSVNISDNLSPSSSSSAENEISKHVRKSTSNERSPPPVEKKSLRTSASRPLPSSEKKGTYGSRAAKSSPSLALGRSGRTRASSRQNETESNRQKVHFKKTPAATRSLPALSTEKKPVLRRTQHGNPISPALSTEKKPVLKRTQFGTSVSRSSASPASPFLSRYSVSGRKSSQHDKNGSASQKSNLKGGNKSIITKRTVVNHSEDKDFVAQKLKFRRGKVIEPQSTEIVAPRRLKFKRRVTVDSILGKGDTESRSSKKGDDESKVEIESVQSESSNKVMLKHHQYVVECKKDSETNLYNNVIEETASKLVETRKSKVKALVGAFETVISLQEKRSN